MPAVGGFGHKGSWLDSLETIAGKAFADLIRAHLQLLMPKLRYDPSGAVTAFMLVENSNHFLFDHDGCSIRLVSGFIGPFIEATSIDMQHFADLLNGVIKTNGIDKSIHDCYIPRLKIPKAFFKISRSCSVRRSSTFKRSISANELCCTVDDNAPFLIDVVEIKCADLYHR